MSEAALPHWDMTPIFPSLESPEFQKAFDTAIEDINALSALFESHQVRKRETPAVTPEFIAAYEEVTARANSLLERLHTLSSYIGCFTTTDARDEAAQARESLLNAREVLLIQLITRYTAWVGSSDIAALISGSEVARAHEYAVRRAHEMYAHQMSEAEEELTAEFRPAGLTGWARLHGNVSALLTARVMVRGEERTLPISAVRSLANDHDREVRRAAYEAELKAWETVAVPMAAALNGIKGFQLTVRRRRRYADDLEPTLFHNGIDRPTLEAMQQACIESFPDFRRYAAAKARALGVDRLAWYDMGAPVGRMARVWTWEEAEGFVRRNFGRYSARMVGFAEQAFRDRWIDAEPRVGKEGGAYCTSIRAGESRILMNFDGSFTSVSTAAHELGHAYHNLNLAARTPMQRSTPATMAETASIFCETLAFDAALEDADRDERIALLDTSLQRDMMVVVDIHSRFLFERSVFERRAERDLTVSEFNHLMLDAQQQTYGEAVAPLHPAMWQVKGHYYGPTFYNYPYTYGLLFGLGLYARYRHDPEPFRAQYDDLLSSTGLFDAITLGSRFGIDVRSVDFWRSSLDVIRREIAEFESLVR